MLYQQGKLLLWKNNEYIISSVHLKKSGIKAFLFVELLIFPIINDLIIFSLLICSFISFSAFLLNQIDKEKETNVKYLLYLPIVYIVKT